MAKPRYLIDSRTYYVAGMGGYRSPWLTRADALALADRLDAEARIANPAKFSPACVYYRDGNLESRKLKD